MSKYGVTWELYNLFVNRTIDAVTNTTKGSDVDGTLGDIAGLTVPYVDMGLGMGTEAGLPVLKVTRHSASAFYERLCAETGYFYRFPSEAEWEHTRWAGRTIAYHFGDDVPALDDYAWHYKNTDDTYHKVGQKKPNPWGLYEIQGNMAE